MSKKNPLPKELRVKKSHTENRFYDKQIYPAQSNQKKSLLKPIIIFSVLTILFIVFFRGYLEVAIVASAFVFLALGFRWFFFR